MAQKTFKEIYRDNRSNMSKYDQPESKKIGLREKEVFFRGQFFNFSIGYSFFLLN